MQPYRRGTRDTDYELSRVQDRMENWSDELDGEDGMIRQFQDDRAERRATVRMLKFVAGALAGVTGVQAAIAIFQAFHGH